MNPHPISVDNYFVNRVNSPRDEQGNYDYEALECIDMEQFNADMADLLAGKTVELPQYNFVTGEREYKGDFMTLRKGDILVIEGIHCLNDRLSYALPKESKFRIYISALTQLNIDEHNQIPTTDGRLLRRMIRTPEPEVPPPRIRSACGTLSGEARREIFSHSRKART